MTTINLITEIPGPKSLDIIRRREAASARGLAKLTQVSIAKAQGAAVTDADGNTLLDFAGGIGVLAVGHCPPPVVSAVQQQAAELIHMCAIVATYEPMVAVCELLNRITPGNDSKKTMLLNSGAEAVESAVKIARAYTGRPAIIVFEGAYHGRTNLTMAMTSKYALFKKGFGPFAPEVYRIPFPNVYRRPSEMSEEGYVDHCVRQLENALIAYVDPSAVAAIVVEPVQGEAGFIPCPPRFLHRIRELCDEYGLVMIADEIQCGLGRTGKLFACDHYDVVPDLITTAKALAAGMPLAAVTGKAEIMDAPHPGGLGGTYSANPLACAAALEAIKMIDTPAFLGRAAEIGARLRGYLEQIQADHPHLVGDVRGLGPMLAMEIVTDPDSKTPDMETTSAITGETLKRGLITIRAGLYSNCVRLLPPLTLTDEQIAEGMAVLAQAVKAVDS